MAKKVTAKQAEAEVNKNADQVSAADVNKAVADVSSYKKLFSCVEKLKPYYDDVVLVLSMLKDYTTGKYTQCPWRTIAMLVGSLAYVLSPLDLIPDFIPIIGWTDDCLALGAALAFAKDDLERYKAWKDTKGRALK